MIGYSSGDNALAILQINCN